MAREELFEQFCISDVFCEGLARFDQVGSCRRLIFMVRDTINNPDSTKIVVAKIVVPAEVMFDIAQMIAADHPVSAALAAIPHDALAN
jgi:hypothetical protein